MPNTLAHFGLHGAASRVLFRGADARWILAGAILPDVPWILRRAVATLVPSVDPFRLRAYVGAQAALAGTLLLAGGLALLSRRPRLIFPLLAFNSLLHLVLDGLERKWGPGVLLAAPFSWREWNDGFFWPEDPLSYVLTLFGVVVAIYLWKRPGEAVGWRRPPGRAAAGAAALLAAYAVFPFLIGDALFQANPNLLHLRSPTAGASIEFDRVDYADGKITSWARQGFDARGSVPDGPGKISLRGAFTDAKTIRVDDLHVHDGVNRSWFSYLGLAWLGLVWLRGGRRGG